MDTNGIAPAPPPGFQLEEQGPPVPPPGFQLESEMAQPVQAEKPKSWASTVLPQLKNLSVGDAAMAIGENAFKGLSTLGGMAYGGLTAIGQQTVGRAMGLPPPDPVQTIEDKVEGSAYEPKTVPGMALEMGLGDSASQMSRSLTRRLGIDETEMPLYDLAFNLGGEDDTLGAAAAYTALTAATAALGEGVLSGKGKSKSKTSAKPKGASEKIDAAYSVLNEKVNDYYKRADEAGGAVKAEAMQPMVARVEDNLLNEGFDVELHPGTAVALRVLNDAKQSNQTMKGVEINRKKLNGALAQAVRNSKDDARLANIVKRIYDDWYTTLPESAYLFKPDADAAGLYKQGRELAHQKFKADEITWAIERAGLRANQFSGSGFDNALKTEFRQILMNPNRRRMFNDVEIELLETIIDGSFPQKAASFIGRFAVRGPVSGALTTGPAAMIGGPIGAIAAIALGEAGRRTSQVIRRRSAEDAAMKVIEGETRR